MVYSIIGISTPSKGEEGKENGAASSNRDGKLIERK